MNKVKKIVNDELFEWIRGIRRTIHQWPEPAFKEEKTAGLISKALNKLGIKHQTGIAQTGVVGRLITDKDAPTVALRADMDALFLTEDTDLPFASQNTGIMHACGHDGHVAIVLGAAAILRDNPPEGNVVFIFQPAEEGEGGAKPMIEQGALDGVDIIFGGHIERHYQVGEIGIKTGIHTSHTDAFEIRVTGKGGHAARPHLAIDAVFIASQLVVNLQTIVSRQVDPVHPSVLTIGYIKAGTVYNAIAEKAVLKGTIRTTDESVRAQIIEKVRKMASSLSILYDAEIKVISRPGYPPIINEERATKFAVQVAEKLLGREKTIAIPYPSLGGEDFSYYLQQIPGCFVRFGAAKEGHETVSSHSPKFDFDEEALRVGAAYMSELAGYTIKKLRRS
ncbi:MAG TPA: amidohydrolase [Nitrospirae bacterium]|nr:putative hydrolase YxeP [bacterium BMS3Abin06]HDH11142.1 amidohydrolase [Nitrospirota bacterium]HDZ02621.1 amidohydrolase [Nitrospirota bacterium]